jgi:hypothetical protein
MNLSTCFENTAERYVHLGMKSLRLRERFNCGSVAAASIADIATTLEVHLNEPFNLL